MMKSEKTIEELEQELIELKEQHESMWNTYGSELCAGDMIRQEEELEKKITRLKAIEHWDKSGGLLEGISEVKIVKLFENQKNL